MKTQAIDPGQVLNYVACHDNYTLYDQLVQTMNEDRLPSAYLQAESIIFLMQGIPFIQEGEEFMRSKLDPDTGKYEGNSYISGDFVNVMDYSLKVDHLDICEKIRELISLRSSCEQFRLATREEISARMTQAVSDKGNVSYGIDDLLVIHSLTGTTVELDGTYEILYSNLRDAGEKVTGSVDVMGNESIVLRKGE